MQDFKTLLGNVLISYDNETMPEGGYEAHLQTLMDWYEQVIKLADFARDKGYDFVSYNYNTTCEGCGKGMKPSDVNKNHNQDCPVAFAENLLKGGE